MPALSPQDEKAYSKQVINDGRVQLRVVFAVLIVLYGGFGYLDLLLIEDYLRDFLLIRFAIVIPLFVITFLLTFYPVFQRIGQYLLLFNLIVSGSGISYMLMRHPDNMSYYGGIFMVIFAGYFLIKLNTRFATAGSLINLAFYSGGYFIYHQGFDLDMMVMLIFFFGSNVIGIVGSYQLEAANKIKFRQEKEIKQKNWQLETRVSEQHETLLRIEKAVESTSDAIGIFDIQGQIFYMNKALRNLTGFMLEEFKENNDPELIYEGSGQLKGILSAVRDGGSWKGEQVVISRTGEKYITLLHADAVRNYEGEMLAFILIHKDITDRKQAEAEIRKLNEELEQRVKERTIQMEAVNKELESFAYSVSHDLRAPLRALDGFSANLKAKYDDHLDDQGRHYLNRIHKAALYMSDLIDDLLKLSRVTRAEFKKQQVDLSKLAAEIFAALQEAEPQYKARLEISPGLSARGDASLLRVVMENLLGNAWKFSTNEKETRIEVGRTVIEEVEVFYIRDNGAGFDMTYADKLFGAFQRLHGAEEFPGTGVGLATVQRVINRHGGKVWAEGEVGKGATFYFTLP